MVGASALRRLRRGAGREPAARRGPLEGPPLALPRPLDAAAERWARLRPRVRVLLLIGLLAGLLATTTARVHHAEQRWGGPPITVLVAEADLPAGAPPEALRRVTLPPPVVPDAALTHPGEIDGPLTAPLPAGAVLTSGHLAPRGPAAELEADRRAVPLPVEDGWAVTAGAWVDVWRLGGAEPAELVASNRPVLAIHADQGSRTALVALDVDEVAAVTAGLAGGRLLLTHGAGPARQ